MLASIHHNCRHLAVNLPQLAYTVSCNHSSRSSILSILNAPQSLLLCKTYALVGPSLPATSCQSHFNRSSTAVSCRWPCLAGHTRPVDGDTCSISVAGLHLLPMSTKTRSITECPCVRSREHNNEEDCKIEPIFLSMTMG